MSGLLLLLLLGGVVALPAAETFSSAFLSEIMAEHQQGLQDEDGDFTGWIELLNGGGSTVNLGGWYLTDTLTNLTKWRFPGVGLLPDKYLVVFASAKDRTNDLLHLHTNFRLNGAGGYLALVGPLTNIVSEFAPGYPRQRTDVSYGRVREEPAWTAPFPRATPGRPNVSRGAGFAPEPGFSRPGGSFTEAFTLQLTSRTAGGVIRYTLDGTLPMSRSPEYREPLRITNSTQVRARLYQEGLLPGPPRSEAFLRLDPGVTPFTSTLPILIMDSLGRGTTVSAGNSFVHLSFHEPVSGRTSLTNPATLTTRAGYRVRGSTSAGMPQPGFAMHFLDEFNQEQDLAPLGMPPASDWILYAPNAYDPVLIHNPFVHQLSRDLGRYSPRTRFVEVFLVRNSGRVRESHYAGIYVLTEKIDIGKHRIAIDHLGAEDLKPPAVTGGYLLKFDRLGPGENGVTSEGERGLVYVEPKEPLITLPQRAAQKQYLTGYLNEFERALHGPAWKDPMLGYRAYLDVEAAIDFHVLEVLSGNVDAMVLSTYFYKPRNGKIVCGPHWDFDRALGSTDGRDENPRMWNTGPFFGGAWWPRLFRDVDFSQRWVDRWQELRQTHFSVTNLHGLIDRQCAELREAQPRQYQRWDFQPRGGSYQSEINHMKRWLSERVDFIDGELVPPPRLDRAGGRIASGSPLHLTVPAPSTNITIYYTLDGTDPRLAQGAVSSNAVVYAGPIRLSTDAQIIARARNPRQQQSDGPPVSTPWSGPVSARFIVTPPAP